LDRAISQHFVVGKELLNASCQFNSTQKKACPIQLNFNNTSGSSLNFQVILQEAGLDIALFDGIAERAEVEGLSTTKSRQYYFDVDSTDTIRIFFTSYTSDTIIILAHFIEEQEFLYNSSNVYLDYQENSADRKDNFYRFYNYGSGSKLFAISPEDIEKNCKRCVLTLAVYAKYTSTSLSVFELEVSQQETAISIGDSNVGYLEQGDIYVYQLDQPTSGDALVSIHDRSKESSIQRNCFRVSFTG
jgi:hypothetical protein